VVTASADNTARVWDAATGKPLAPPLAHQEMVTSAAFSPRGHRERRQDRAGLGCCHRQASRARARALGMGVERGFSPDGTRVVTASADNTAQVWEIQLDSTPCARGGLPWLREVYSRSAAVCTYHANPSHPQIWRP